MFENYFTEKSRKEFSRLFTKGNGLSQRIFAYVFAVIICILGVGFKLLLVHLIHYPEGGLMISLGTTMISSWYGGFGPGVVTILLSYFIADWFFISPGQLFFNDSPSVKVRFIIFLSEGILISWMFELLHRAHKKTKETLFIIKQNELLLRSLVANIADHAIFLVDMKGYIKTWSEGAVKMTGYHANEALQKPLSLLFPKGERGKKTLLLALQTAAADGQYKQESWKMRKDQSLFWTETIITALPAAFPTEQNFSVIIHDITTRKKAEDLKNDFFSIITHELKTPIAVMNVVVEKMVRHFSQKPKLEKELSDVFDLQGEVNRLALLVENLLDITRIRTQRLRFDFQKCELSSILAAVAAKMQLVAGDNASILVDTTKPLTIVADKGKLEQVLMNLLDNAIRFTPKGGHIEVSTHMASDIVTVSVANESTMEIPKDKRLLLFDKYYQVARKSVKGFGIGLYLSNVIIKKHKGTFRVDSTKKRTVFSFSIPVKQSELTPSI